MTETVNGWPVVLPDSNLKHTWEVPLKQMKLDLTCRNGSVGMILIFWAVWLDEKVEKLSIDKAVKDDGAYNYRPKTGGGGVSAHAGYAEDLNWARHPYNVPTAHTFTPAQVRKIHRKMAKLNHIAGARVIEWGGDWPSHPGSTAKTDAMHWQVNPPMEACEKLARYLMTTKRGKRVLKVNPGQKTIILS